MSENSLINLTESFQSPESFSTSKPAVDRKEEEAAKIFDLISQLNTTLITTATNTNGGTSGIAKKVEECKQVKSSGTSGTKIPRINFLHSKPPQPTSPQSIAQDMSSSASNSSMGSIPTHNSQPMSPDVDSMIPRPVPATVATSRVPRSIVRNSAAMTNGCSSIENSSSGRVSGVPLSTNGVVSNTKIPGIAKRGVSLSNAPGKMKTTRSMSINDGSKENLDDCESVISSEGKKKVRYVIRHKPRESQVKIFSQKVEVKAQAKIGSLEKAATYKPQGGNVKIESHKLNWNAQAKIGSLEHASNYTPKGGNVKIESFKLNFKEKARPKTDTGLIVVEEFIDTKSYNNSNDDLTKSQLSFTGSN